MLARTRAIHQAGRAIVPGASVYFVELDHERKASRLAGYRKNNCDNGNGCRLIFYSCEHGLVLAQLHFRGVRAFAAFQIDFGGLQKGGNAPNQ